MIFYFSTDNTKRILFKDNKVKIDNIMNLNHGMVNPSLVNIFTFLETLCTNNIYKYANHLNYKSLIIGFIYVRICTCEMHQCSVAVINCY